MAELILFIAQVCSARYCTFDVSSSPVLITICDKEIAENQKRFADQYIADAKGNAILRIRREACPQI